MDQYTSYADYEAKCKRLFNARRYGWTSAEQSICQQACYGYLDGGDGETQVSPEDAVYRMNSAYVRAKADRHCH